MRVYVFFLLLPLYRKQNLAVIINENKYQYEEVFSNARAHPPCTTTTPRRALIGLLQFDDHLFPKYHVTISTSVSSHPCFNFDFLIRDLSLLGKKKKKKKDIGLKDRLPQSLKPDFENNTVSYGHHNISYS